MGNLKKRIGPKGNFHCDFGHFASELLFLFLYLQLFNICIVQIWIQPAKDLYVT